MTTGRNTPRPSTSRRAFLAGGGRTVLGACAFKWLSPLATQAGESPGNGGPKLRFGFTTYQWGKDWDIPTLISNLEKAGVLGTELRTSQAYAHGVELELGAAQRREVRKRFADTPILLVGIASGERMDWPDPARLETALEAAKAHVQLSHDVGAGGVRVFPNQFHPQVSREKTLEQIARALDRLGAFAADYGQEIRLEAHGAAGDLPTMRTIMDQVGQRNVRIALNSDARDIRGQGFEHNYNLVKDFLGHTLHLHDLADEKFPYQLQANLLATMNWDGWSLLEVTHKVPDRVQALIEQRRIWERIVANALEATR